MLCQGRSIGKPFHYLQRLLQQRVPRIQSEVSGISGMGLFHVNKNEADVLARILIEVKSCCRPVLFNLNISTDKIGQNCLACCYVAQKRKSSTTDSIPCPPGPHIHQALPWTGVRCSFQSWWRAALGPPLSRCPTASSRSWTSARQGESRGIVCLKTYLALEHGLAKKTDSVHITLFCNVGESPALRSDHGPQKVEVGKEVDVIPYLGIDVTVGVISSEAALDHRPFGKEFQVRKIAPSFTEWQNTSTSYVENAHTFSENCLGSRAIGSMANTPLELSENNLNRWSLLYRVICHIVQRLSYLSFDGHR